jgi:hypothetical protein
MIFRLSYTRMASAARCPRYHYFDYVLKITTQKEQLGMRFGFAGHTGIHALYDTRNLKACLEAAEKAWAPYEGMDVDKGGKPGVRTLAKLKEILTAYHDQIFLTEDWTDEGGEKEEVLLISVPSVHWYLFSKAGYAPFYVYYTAKIDRRGISGKVPAIQELKFLKPFLGSEFVPEPNNQIVGYLKASNRRKAVVTVAKVQQSSIKGMVQPRSKKDEPYSIFTRDPVFYSDFVFEEFEKDVIGWAVSILTWKLNKHYPKSAPDACNMYGGCPYKVLCSVEPIQREVMIELGFKKKEFHE